MNASAHPTTPDKSGNRFDPVIFQSSLVTFCSHSLPFQSCHNPKNKIKSANAFVDGKSTFKLNLMFDKRWMKQFPLKSFSIANKRLILLGAGFFSVRLFHRQKNSIHRKWRTKRQKKRARKEEKWIETKWQVAKSGVVVNRAFFYFSLRLCSVNDDTSTFSDFCCSLSTEHLMHFNEKPILIHFIFAFLLLSFSLCPVDVVTW